MTLTERLGIDELVDLKSLIIGTAIAATFAIVGMRGGIYEYAYPFSSIGFLYVGYKAINMKMAVLLGMLSASPLIYLAYENEIFGPIPTEQTFYIMVISIILVGIFVSSVGYYTKINREKAKKQYAEKQKISKNKKKNKNKNKK